MASRVKLQGAPELKGPGRHRTKIEGPKRKRQKSPDLVVNEKNGKTNARSKLRRKTKEKHGWKRNEKNMVGNGIIIGCMRKWEGQYGGRCVVR